MTIRGTIEFEPTDYTKKHKQQASWKRIAMVMLGGDVCQYYAWYIAKRYNLALNKPLRNAHVTFINDSYRDLSHNGQKTQQQVDELWTQVKNTYNNQQVDVTLSLEPRTNGNIWWFNIPEDSRVELQSIRNELGLGRPFFGMHMTIGLTNERTVSHSAYIHECIKSGLI